MTVVKSLLLDESGQGMTEYAILIGTLALGAKPVKLFDGGATKEATVAEFRFRKSLPES